MTERDRRSFEAQDFGWLVALSLVFFALVAGVFWREERTDWAPIQKRFREILEKNGHVDEARAFREGIRQIWNPELDVVDRCVTCHLGYDWVGTLPADLPQPFAPHPPLPYLDKHPFARFGCTPCHGGEGWATQIEAGHGGDEHWAAPLLSRKLAESYGLSEGQLMQMRCNSCHRHDASTPGMEDINLAKALFKKKKCLVCHTVEGKGGLTAPELTYHGDKNPELFDYTHVTGVKTTFNWEVQHLLNPETFFPRTIMPTFGFEPGQARALALLLMSWKKRDFPPQYIPVPEEAAAAPVTAVREVKEPPAVAGAEPGREIFRTRGCNKCHTVGEGRLIGPDLKGIGSRRAEDWLRSWLADPAAMIRSHPELARWPDEFDEIVMPNQNLSSQEIDALIAYLGKL
jgi:cytochrome c2